MTKTVHCKVCNEVVAVVQSDTDTGDDYCWRHHPDNAEESAKVDAAAPRKK